jgi:hypothetical protein
MVDRVRICSHCALFGEHKDHTFKSEAQFLDELDAQEDRLNQLDRTQCQLQGTWTEAEWQPLKEKCKNKQRELLDECGL